LPGKVANLYNELIKYIGIKQQQEIGLGRLAMLFFKLLLAFYTLLWASTATNDGLTDAVTWDPYSLSINGERVFIL
jgi:hypothetical protein